MKQIFIFSLILFQCTCYAQVVDDYLEKAKWRLSYTCEPEANFFRDIKIELSTGEDTLISGLLYKKIHLDDRLNEQFFMRQDSRKIYYRSANPIADSIEFEVYNFSIEEGEDFVYANEFYQTEFVVASVDSIELLDGTKRKRITFNTPFNIGCLPAAEISQWIEGIGGIPSIPLYFFRDFCWCEFRGFSFSVDDVLLYESDLLIDDVDEPQKHKFDFEQNKNQIEVLSDVQVERLIIHNIDGKTIATVKDNKIIHIDRLSSGIYILEVVFRNQTRGSIKFYK